MHSNENILLNSSNENINNETKNKKLLFIKKNMITALTKNSTNIISEKKIIKRNSIIEQLNNDKCYNIEIKPKIQHKLSNQSSNCSNQNHHLYTNTLEPINKNQLENKNIILSDTNNLTQTKLINNFNQQPQLKNLDSMFIDSAIGSPLWSPDNISFDEISATIELPSTSKKSDFQPNLLENVYHFNFIN